MSRWRSSNVDEMVSVTFAEKGLLPSKEEVHWRVLRVIGFTVIPGGLSSVGNVPCIDVVVRFAANHIGILPRRSGRGAIIRVASDHDGVVPRCPGEDTTVTDVVLDVADDGALRDPTGQL